MENKDELLHDISAIYKFVYSNQGVHRNTLKNKLIQKIPSQKRFNVAFNHLLSNGKLVMQKEMVSIPTSQISTGVLQKRDDEYVIVMPHESKKIRVPRSVASGYHVGDILDAVVDNNRKTLITVLGKGSQDTSALKLESINNSTPSQGETILGRVIKLSHDELIFIPNKKSLPTRQIPILNNKKELATFQDKICTMRLAQQDAPLLGGYIVEIKGDAGNPIHEYDAIAENYGAIMSWEGERIEREIEQIPSQVDTKDLPLITEEQAKTMQKNHVVDLRHIPFVTVDPATCKDMEDAIYSTFDENGNIVCYTAVANATKYFTLYSEIGKRYTQGAFTIYAPNKAYNILPTKLATGICSLNPNEPRLAFVVKTVIDKKSGKAIKSTIYDALIESRKKYTYEQAQEIVDRLQDTHPRELLFDKQMQNIPLTEDELILMNFYAGQTIKQGFENRRMIRFVSNNEREIIFDSGHENVEDIVAIPHLYYHEVIEAFMITANEATAQFTRDHNIPNIYRVHDEPKQNKLNRANEFFKILGIDFDGDLSASGTRALIELIRQTPAEETINQFLIKMQSRAVYSDSLYGGRNSQEQSDWVGECISHYALQSPHYSHSTSIIRRLPDYITHYNILAYMHGKKQISADAIKKIVEIANARQLQVDQAEKDFEDISSVMYCEKHIGEQMHGRISKIRYASTTEGYDDEIIVIVKNPEKGISVEIPLSQILGKQAIDCEISTERCAVYNKKGDILLTLCKPIDFIIEKSDRKSMIVVGRTNNELIQRAEQKSTDYRKAYSHNDSLIHAQQHKKDKSNRQKRIQNNISHHHEHDEDEFEN